MLNYLVIGLCLALLIAVIYFSIKPISMGIEARREFKDKLSGRDKDIEENNFDSFDYETKISKTSISEEILKLNKLKDEGILTIDEYEKAKKKLLS